MIISDAPGNGKLSCGLILGVLPPEKRDIRPKTQASEKALREIVSPSLDLAGVDLAETNDGQPFRDEVPTRNALQISRRNQFQLAQASGQVLGGPIHRGASIPMRHGINIVERRL